MRDPEKFERMVISLLRLEPSFNNFFISNESYKLVRRGQHESIGFF